jgi:hypothetical protein
MAQAWPGSLPDCPLSGWERTGPFGNLMRTEMDVGPAKVRRRGSVGVYRYPFQFRLTTAQLATFENWYINTLGQGAEQFEFVDPISEELSIFRFAGIDGYSVARQGRHRIVSVQWELLPQ